MGKFGKTSKYTVYKICQAALFTAVIFVLSLWGIPVPGGEKLYLVDAAVVAGALLLDPFWAFLAAGVGSFLGDLMFYPAAMFVTLAVHGLQGYIISLIYHKAKVIPKRLRALAASIAGMVIMVLGYTLGCAWVYGSWPQALAALPFEILQGALGAVIGLALVFSFGLEKMKKER